MSARCRDHTKPLTNPFSHSSAKCFHCCRFFWQPSRSGEQYSDMPANVWNGDKDFNVTGKTWWDFSKVQNWTFTPGRWKNLSDSGFTDIKLAQLPRITGYRWRQWRTPACWGSCLFSLDSSGPKRKRDKAHSSVKFWQNVCRGLRNKHGKTHHLQICKWIFRTPAELWPSHLLSKHRGVMGNEVLNQPGREMAVYRPEQPCDSGGALTLGSMFSSRLSLSPCSKNSVATSSAIWTDRTRLSPEFVWVGLFIPIIRGPSTFPPKEEREKQIKAVGGGLWCESRSL